MGVTQVTTCDCCNETLTGNSVLDCIIVTALEQDGTVVQSHYGLACGCAAGVLTKIAEESHVDHAPSQAEPAPEVAAPAEPPA